MTFEEILDHAIAMLQRRGRLTYRALQLQFQLDEVYLEALKDELIYGQRLAADEDSRVLVWTGGTTIAPPTASPVSLPATPDVSPAQGEAALVAPPTSEAERRQLTVMFCDLVDSTRLSGQLDPEDYRDVVRAYQGTCAAVIQRYDGYIAQYLGDGLLVYFGYPRAHEDDALRAGRAGLGMVEALKALHANFTQHQGVRIAVRIGIHTGLVVVGDVGSGSRQEHLALGETPNMAARLQGLAAPDTVVVSAATFQLIQGYFTAEPLGAHTLRGVAAPVHVYRILGESGAQSRLDAVAPTRWTPLVGRDEEVALLHRCWEATKAGLGQVVLLSGEAGIGKSRLVQGLHQHLEAGSYIHLEWRCSPYAQQSPLHPVIAYLHHVLPGRQNDAPAEKLRALEERLAADGLVLPEVVPLFASLLSLPLPDRYPPLPLTPQRQRQKTLEALLAWLLAEATPQPVLLIVEDLHWIDPSTLEFLTLLIDQGPTARLLTLLTCRPEFHAPWGFRAHLTPLTLSRISHPQVEQMIVRIAGGKVLPPEVVEQIVAKTDGVPLFVEELTKMVLESGLLREGEDHYALTSPLPSLAIPATLHDSLMARLDRLATVKALAQLGATLGREFAYELLQAVSLLDDTMLQHGVRQLVEAELLYQRGVPPQATYTFKHVLIQDAAYQSLLKSTRQHYHQRIAEVLVEQFPDTAEAQPALLAHHYTEAGCSEQAIAAWQRAGQQAAEHSAHAEAMAHFTRGLELLQSLPDTPERTLQELLLNIALGTALTMIKGWAAPEVETTYTRARELCQQLGDHPQLFPVLFGLAAFYLIRAELRVAYEFGEQLLHLAQHQADSARLLIAHHGLGFIAFCRGALASAYVHFEHATALYDPHQHGTLAFIYGFDPGVACCAWGAAVRWMLGYPDQALQHSRQALRMAQTLAHPFTQTFALTWAAILHQLRREVSATWECAEAIASLSTAQGFPFYLAVGALWQGWALASQGQVEDGIAQLCQGLTDLRATGTVQGVSWHLVLLAEAYGHAGQPEAGLARLAEGLALMDTNEERFYEAELHRLKGDLLLQSGAREPGSAISTLPLASRNPHTGEAEACFHRALATARRQQAKSLELRAALSLTRLWQQQGKGAEARELLAPVYGWFTEGFDTADLQDAKALLEELVG
jgi:class 3 adenylate cyclase/predicted ATPase